MSAGSFFQTVEKDIAGAAGQALKWVDDEVTSVLSSPLGKEVALLALDAGVAEIKSFVPGFPLSGQQIMDELAKAEAEGGIGAYFSHVLGLLKAAALGQPPPPSAQ